MKNETISRVYAEALLALADEKGQLEGVHDDVALLSKLFSEHPRFRVFLESPGIDRDQKRQIFEVALQGKLLNTTVHFILLVIRKGRQVFFRQMLEEFRILHDKRVGLVRARAVTAVPLEDLSREALRTVLERKTGKRIQLESLVEPSVLGGLIVRYDGRVADGSLQTALSKIEAQMRDVKFGSEIVHEN